METLIRQIARAAPAVALVCACLAVFRLTAGYTCVFEAAVGLPCPGCGMTRAWLRVFSLDLGAAFMWHPLFWLPPVAAALWVFCGITNRRRLLNVCACAAAGLFVAVYIYRVVKLFPHTPPMDINANAYLQRLLRFFAKP